MINGVNPQFQSLAEIKSRYAAGRAAEKPLPEELKTSVFRKALETEMAEAVAKPVVSSRPEVRSYRETLQPQPTLASPEPDEVRPTIPVRQANQSFQTQLQPMIKEVTQIAESVGFVGIQPQDIMRAYNHGQSFLADYRI